MDTINCETPLIYLHIPLLHYVIKNETDDVNSDIFPKELYKTYYRIIKKGLILLLRDVQGDIKENIRKYNNLKYLTTLKSTSDEDVEEILEHCKSYQEQNTMYENDIIQILSYIKERKFLNLMVYIYLIEYINENIIQAEFGDKSTCNILKYIFDNLEENKDKLISDAIFKKFQISSNLTKIKFKTLENIINISRDLEILKFSNFYRSMHCYYM